MLANGLAAVIQEAVDDPVKGAADFLKRNKTAKIVVIIDTHSTENGCFVYNGDAPADYLSCYMLEVGITYHKHSTVLTPWQIIKDCIPAELFKFISNGKKTPKHQHRSLIINLACGSSVTNNLSRSHLLEG